MASIYKPDKDKKKFARYAEFVRRFFHNGVDDGGAVGEGSGYGLYDAERLTIIAEILRRAGAADLWEEEPRFSAMIRHWAYLMLPGERGQDSIGDAFRYSGDLPWWPHLLMARRAEEPVTDRKNKRGPSYLREGSGVRVWGGLGRFGGFGSGFARGFALDT